MPARERARQELARKVEELCARLDEAEETLRAIRGGEVDALVVAGPDGDQVFTLKSADHPYRVFIEEMNEGAVTLSDEGVILYCNRTFAAIVKSPMDQVVGESFASFVKPSDLPALQALLQGSREGRIIGVINGRVPGDAGASVPLRLSLTRLPNGSNDAICIVATDLTEGRRREDELSRAQCELEEHVAERTSALAGAFQELEASRSATQKLMEDAVEARKAVEAANLALREEMAQRVQAEVALCESEHHFRTLANSGLALIWTSGPDKLCNYFNETWLRYTGRTLEQEFGNGWAEGVHPEDFDRCLNIYVSHFERRQPFSMEYRLRNATGEYGWILDLGSPRYDSEGNFTGYIGHCYDVTERKRAEAALAESERRFRDLVEGLPQLVWTCRAEGPCDYLNRQWVEYTGIREDEQLGFGWLQQLHPDDRQRTIDAWNGTVGQGAESFEVEFRIRRADGQHR